MASPILLSSNNPMHPAAPALGTREAVRRIDGKHNIWKWMFLAGNIVPTWVLIGVVREPRKEQPR